jgi:putative ABC transport system permease protein
MFYFKLIIRNALRHRLRTALTVIGVAIAVLAFGMLRTLVGLWYLGVENASATRLVTRNAISLIFPLPISYYERIRQVSGVSKVSYGDWFGGIYIDEKHFFANYAIEPRNYLDLYPEFIISADEKEAFIRDRKGCICGRKLADRFGWRVGDLITLKGTVFPGEWEFVLRGIYRGRDKGTEERLLNETLRRTMPLRADQVGYYILGVERPGVAAQVAQDVDRLFRNSLAETLTETEQAFHLGFVSMTEAIMVAIQIVSYVVILIIMVVAANTMAMTARERVPEYATMKGMGFGPAHLAFIIFGESIIIALTGGVTGALLTFPASRWIETELAEYFPHFSVSMATIYIELSAAFVVGAVAAIFPAWRSSTIPIAEGLRRIG